MVLKFFPLAGASIIALSTAANANSFVFTDDADWDQGSYASTNSGPPGADDQVQLNPGITTNFNFLWVAASGRDSAILIDTNHQDADGRVTLAESAAGNGAVIGEYYTRPNGRGGNPSRTTVDLNGDVWIGNRNESSGGEGSVVKISSSPAAGGTTSDGEWNGSTFDRLNWSNAGGADNNGGTSTASDAAISQYVRTDGTAIRAVAVDANNDVWVGGFNNKVHQRIDGATGVADPAFNLSPGGYGGLVDGNGILWSSGWSSSQIARYDTVNGVALAPANTGGSSYGLGIDSQGNIWNSHYLSPTISKLDSAGNLLGTFSTGPGTSNPSGVAVTPDDHVWVANRFSNNVTRLDNAGNVVAVIPTETRPIGVSVDSNGKVWVANQVSNSAQRIDPAGNAVDLTVELGAGASPYNYSDMTGSVVGGVTNPTGTWTSILDSGMAGSLWDKIMWNQEAEGTIPAGSSIVVEVRFADSLLDLAGEAFSSYGQMDDLTGMMGQFAEILVTLTRPGTPGAASPVLSDLKLTTKMMQTSTVPLPMSAWLLLSGVVGLFGLGRRRSRLS